MIAAGRVAIEGRVAILGDRVVPETAVVTIDGARIPIAPDLVTYMLYKPPDVISTVSDPQGRATVVDLVPQAPRVWPVGRLDADSEGLILLSNDGTLTNLVTHPRYGITKTYLVVVEASVGKAFARALVAGVELEDGPARAVSARILDRRPNTTMVEVVMNEGRNREIRRMTATLGHPVVRLVRTAIGPIVDRQIRSGKWRRLEPAEVASIYAAAKGAEHPG